MRSVIDIVDLSVEEINSLNWVICLLEENKISLVTGKRIGKFINLPWADSL